MIKQPKSNRPTTSTTLKNWFDWQLRQTRVLLEFSKESPNVTVPLFKKALKTSSVAMQRTALFELTLLSETNPVLATEILQQTLDELHPYSLKYENIRVLVATGKKSPALVIPFFQTALYANNPETRWAAMDEFIEVVRTHSLACLPTLEKLMDHWDPHLQWTAILVLLSLGNQHPAQIQNLFDRILNSEPDRILANSEQALNESPVEHFNTLKECQNILENSDSPQQWSAMLSLVSLSRNNPKSSIPLLTKAFCCPDPHIQWLAMLGILQLIKRHPHLSSQIYGKLLYTHKKSIDGIRVLPTLRLDKQAKNPALYRLFTNILDDEQTELREIMLHEIYEIYKTPKKLWRFFRLFFMNSPNRTALEQSRILVEMSQLNQEDHCLVIKTLHSAVATHNQSLQFVALQELDQVMQYKA